jgi:hypothetical protein
MVIKAAYLNPDQLDISSGVFQKQDCGHLPAENASSSVFDIKSDNETS